MTSERRRGDIVAAARRLLEQEGPGALTMRRLADVLGIRAPSLYKHLADKDALHRLLAAQAMTELGDALARPRSVGGMARAYRAFALAHPQLYLLITETPLPAGDDVSAAEARARRPADLITGDPDRSRAIWAFFHGMTVLEVRGRFPAGADVDLAWRIGLDAFAATAGR